jgi:cell division protein ZapA
MAGMQEARATSTERANATQAAVAAALNAAAERIEQVTKALNHSRAVGVSLG